jgi:hypothetical protein
MYLDVGLCFVEDEATDARDTWRRDASVIPCGASLVGLGSGKLFRFRPVYFELVEFRLVQLS